MKLIGWMVCLCLILPLAPGCRKQDWRVLDLHVPGMRNDAALDRVMQALSRAPGIQPGSVVVDRDRGMIRLTYDSLLAADKNFEYLIARAGFDVNEIPADKQAQAALPPSVRP